MLHKQTAPETARLPFITDPLTNFELASLFPVPFRRAAFIENPIFNMDKF